MRHTHTNVKRKCIVINTCPVCYSHDSARVANEFSIWVDMLERGVRLPCPDSCHPLIYNMLMMPCWDHDPAKRPNFKNLQEMQSGVELRVT